MYRRKVKLDNTWGPAEIWLDTGATATCLIADCFGGLGLSDLSIHEAETAMSTQGFDGLLFNGGRCDAQILQSREVVVLHVRCVELQMRVSTICYALDKGSPTLLQESYHPADFSSNPNQTHLKQLIKVFRATYNYRQVCCSRVETEVCRMVALQEQG